MLNYMSFDDLFTKWRSCARMLGFMDVFWDVRSIMIEMIPLAGLIFSRTHLWALDIGEGAEEE